MPRTTTFEEWEQSGMRALASHQPQIRSSVGLEGIEDASAATSGFVLQPQTILEAEHAISRNTHNILMTENPTDDNLHQMQKLNIVNCLHKGNFDACQGKRYLVAIDGSES